MNDKISPYAYPGLRGVQDYMKLRKKSSINEMRIIRRVCEYYEVMPKQLFGSSRKRKFVEPRYMAWYLMRKHTDLTLKTMGNIFDRDHATVLHGLRAIQGWIDNDREMDFKYNALESKLI